MSFQNCNMKQTVNWQHFTENCILASIIFGIAACPNSSFFNCSLYTWMDATQSQFKNRQLTSSILWKRRMLSSGCWRPWPWRPPPSSISPWSDDLLQSPRGVAARNTSSTDPPRWARRRGRGPLRGVKPARWSGGGWGTWWSSRGAAPLASCAVVGFLPRAAVMGFRPRRRRGLPLALDSGRGGDGFGAQKSSTRPNQLLSARDLSVRSTLGDSLSNGAAASIPASEHETRSSSCEATTRPSPSWEKVLSAKMSARRRLADARCTCPKTTWLSD